MRLFALRNTDVETSPSTSPSPLNSGNAKVLAIVAWYPETGEWWIDLPEGADPWEVPLGLSSFASRGRFDVPPEWATRWVESRIVPPSRQNIGEILRVNGLDNYDTLRLIELTGGRNSQDSCWLEPIGAGQAPDWFEERRQGWLSAVVALGDFRLLAVFRDGGLRMCRADEILGVNGGRRFVRREQATVPRSRLEVEDIDPRVVSDEAIFAGARLGADGRCVKWGDAPSARVMAATLRSLGSPIGISLDDLRSIMGGLLVDTSQVAEILGCTRQNVNALVKRGSLKPLKAMSKCTLFLRSDL